MVGFLVGWFGFFLVLALFLNYFSSPLTLESFPCPVLVHSSEYAEIDMYAFS